MVSRQLADQLRRCPAPGVERPTRPTLLAYAERGNSRCGLEKSSPPNRKSGPIPQRAQEGARSERRQAERPGEGITRRITPDGVP